VHNGEGTFSDPPGTFTDTVQAKFTSPTSAEGSGQVDLKFDPPGLDGATECHSGLVTFSSKPNQ